MCTCVVHSCLSGMYAYASVRMSQGPGAVRGGGGALKRGKREKERVAYVFMYITFMHLANTNR